MCGVAGFKGKTVHGLGFVLRGVNLNRGRDGYGSYAFDGDAPKTFRTPGKAKIIEERCPLLDLKNGVGLLNCRAEPTTEQVPNPTQLDQQPYLVGEWAVVHNGTVANDKELLARFGLKSPTRIDSWVIAGLLDLRSSQGLSSSAAFEKMLGEIIGSFAIIAHHMPTDKLFYATNYRPLYHGSIDNESHYVTAVRRVNTDVMVDPYSWGEIRWHGLFKMGSLYEHRDPTIKPRTLVVLSGGLDSACVAAMLRAKGHEIELLHVDYGCRATTQERLAVHAIADYFGARLRIIETDIFRTIGNSRLLDGSVINNGEAGAEQAIEWVPARNTILASIAIGIAEANGFDHIALGINLEESGGGYTDNVLDLYDGLNGLMHWIVGVGKKLSFISPVGGLMKHEIVREGLKVNAPFALSWSCYNQGEQHCGRCGPCTMRRRAFARNGTIDPVKFECSDE